MNAFQHFTHLQMSEPDLLAALAFQWERHLDGLSQSEKRRGFDWFHQIARVAEERGLGHLVEQAKTEAEARVRTKDQAAVERLRRSNLRMSDYERNQWVPVLDGELGKATGALQAAEDAAMKLVGMDWPDQPGPLFDAIVRGLQCVQTSLANMRLARTLLANARKEAK